jgi:hypothetical protein
MRVVFLLLLLANLLFFGWANWIDSAAPRARPASVPALQLAPRAAARVAAAPTHCRSLGPYADETAATGAGAVLAQRGTAVRTRRVDGTLADGYWVYVAAAGPAQQQRAMKLLARAGVRDAAVVADDPRGGRVSAGIFSGQKGAEERAAAVRRAGLEPVLEARQMPASVWWVDLTLAVADAGPRADEAALGGGNATLQLTDCPQ